MNTTFRPTLKAHEMAHHLFLQKGFVLSGGRTNRGGRSNRGSTVFHNILCSKLYYIKRY